MTTEKQAAQPVMECPQCHKVEEDFDGFGVLCCDGCGYCTHSAIDGDVCSFCGKNTSEEVK